jgi:hypothetical protein
VVISLCNLALQAHFVMHDMETPTYFLALEFKKAIGPCAIK